MVNPVLVIATENTSIRWNTVYDREVVPYYRRIFESTIAANLIIIIATKYTFIRWIAVYDDMVDFYNATRS